MYAWPSWFPPAKQVVVVEEEKAVDVEKQAMSVWKSILKRKGLPLNTPYKYVESFAKDYDESYCDMLFIKAKKIKEGKREKKRQKSINGIVYKDPELQNKKRLLILKSREENASVCLGNIVCITNLNSFSSSDTPTFWLDPSAKFFLTADPNERVKIGDSVLVSKSPEEGVYPALVGDIHYENNDKIVVVERYYSPEQTLGGRRSFHGNKELIATDHLESISSRSIQRKCSVHSFFSYTRLKHVGPYDYFSRFHYLIGGGWLTPDPVDVRKVPLGSSRLAGQT
ncbi:chromatin remodeling protein EBS [Artemisia annua]|uniref:Chromatin remodeling protein EBS n=1 Tax=Artemisia annua TaxID=35608 RepID=A0A2U1K9Q1_ARTAN|nr:chromatin remodeling protein EBS [Artemisia annua]